MVLEELRNSPGVRFHPAANKREKLMVIELCAGMVRDGSTARGGKTTIPVVSLQTGNTLFMFSDELVTIEN